MGCTLEGEHLRGTLNIEADALSRLTHGSSVPVCRQYVRRLHPPVRNDSWVLNTKQHTCRSAIGAHTA